MAVCVLGWVSFSSVLCVLCVLCVCCSVCDSEVMLLWVWGVLFLVFVGSAPVHHGLHRGVSFTVNNPSAFKTTSYHHDQRIDLSPVTKMSHSWYNPRLTHY